MTESDPHGTNPHAPGAKLDSGKILAWLCISGFSRALAEVAKVTTKGAEKYTPNGWMTVPDGEHRYMDAMARHMLALGRGEITDKDTGCMHKAQVAWNALASLELELRAQEVAKPTDAAEKQRLMTGDLVFIKPGHHYSFDGVCGAGKLGVLLGKKGARFHVRVKCAGYEMDLPFLPEELELEQRLSIVPRIPVGS